MSEFNPFETKPTFSKELIPEGIHRARCVRVIEIGVQESEQYGDKNKVVVVFSLPDILMEIGGEQKQKFISRGYGVPISYDDRSIIKEYTRALCPHGGVNNNFSDFLDQPCQVVVRHKPKKDRVIEDLASVAPIIPGMEVPPADTKSFWFSWNHPDPEIWGMIPDFTKELIKSAANYKGSYVEEMVVALENDELPF